jgi:hypothetical protein
VHGMWQSEVVKLACMECGKVMSDISTSKTLRVDMYTVGWERERWGGYVRN